MECHDCGTSILARAAFCHECGAPAKKRKKKRSQNQREPQVKSRRQTTDRDDDRWAAARQKIVSPSIDDQEEFLWSGTFSFKGMANEFLAAIVISVLLPIGVIVSGAEQTLVNWAFIAVALGWLVLLGNLVIRKLDVHYELTNQRLIHKYGILRRTVNRIEVIDIDDVLFEQGIVERILGSGTIEIISSDKTDPTIELQGIDDVFEIAELIDEARRAERIRRGIHIESV